MGWISKNKIKNTKYVIAIGNGKTRKEIVERLGIKDNEFVTIIHPSATVSDSAKIGRGTVIQAGTIITVNVNIGNHCRVDTSCTIAHDSRIDNFVDISPGAHINGTNKIQIGAFIGSATTTRENISIGKWSVIGAGAVLVTDVPSASLYVGVPGKLKKKLSVPK
jgi:acetyltransferase EpsM